MVRPPPYVLFAGLNNPNIGKIECNHEIWFEANELQGTITSLSPAQRSCEFLFQQYVLFPHLTALDNLTWNGSQHLFHVVDKGKIPPNTPVAWVVPAGGLSLLASPTVTTIACSVEQISALGQIAVIQLCTVDGKHNIIWGASVAEGKRLGLAPGISTFLEIDGNKIHIMPLRPINDPRRFTN